MDSPLTLHLIDIITVMNIYQLLQSKQYLFWALQFLGWSGWALSFFLGANFWGKTEPLYPLYLCVIATLGMFISLGLRVIYHYIWDMSVGKRMASVLVSAYIAALVWINCRSFIYPQMFPEKAGAYARKVAETTKQTEADGLYAMFSHSGVFSFFEGAIAASWVMLVWTCLYFGIKYYMLLQEEKERGLKALSMAHEAQLKMLRYQLNPHFLFNTLNAISTLVLDKDTQLANTMVTRLSRFLRYSLDNDPMQKVTVTEEVETLKLYLDIEKVRFDDRLGLHFDIEEKACNALMPSLLLQPLVENAIKYAIATAINGGNICISAKVFGNDLLLAVADDGPGLESPSPNSGSNGVGLRNCRERLLELYGDEQSFRLSTTQPHGLTINIRLPLTQDSQQD